MLSNYFKIALRIILRNRLYACINIAGLAVGMTGFILIALYIQYELSYDTQHQKANQIYRVAQQQQGNVYRGTDLFTGSPAALAPTLKAEFPEVAEATTLQVHESRLANGNKVYSARGLFADENVFSVFTYPILEGKGKKALEDPNTILLTQSLAKKFFSEENPIGKTLLFQNERPLTVRGVLADIPSNEHFTFDYITSFTNYPYYQGDRNAWNSNNFLTYVVLPADYDYRIFEEKLVSLNRYLGGYADLPFKPKFFLQPLLRIHLHSQLNFEKGTNGDIAHVYLLSSIAFIILLLAAINYTNLTTAQSVQRTKEVAMRKVIGAHRQQLMYQFLGESFLLTSISFVLALALAYSLLPAFNQLVDRSISVNATDHYGVILAMFVAALLVGGLSGLYPAIFLSALPPVRALKGNFWRNKLKGISLRNVLVTGQFVASIGLAIGGIIIYRQLQYMQEKALGYNREQIVYVPYRDADISQKQSAIRAELLRNPQIERVSFPMYLPFNISSETIVHEWEGNDKRTDLFIYNNHVDYDFMDLFQIKLKEGRNFSPYYPIDSAESYILNESAVKALGWQAAVGKQFKGGKVIGVVKDFHFLPLGLTIKPLFLTLRNSTDAFNTDYIAIKLKTGNLENTLDHIQRTVKSLLPQYSFEYRFMDEAYTQLYQSEKRLGQTFALFTLLALFIACMGLFGLISQQVVQRTKEIGIRKVLGASVVSIAALLSQDFLRLVSVSILIASPLAWYAGDKWLQDFAYKIDIEWWVFALAGGLAVLIALLTVSFQSIKAALADPVKSLRSE